MSHIKVGVSYIEVGVSHIEDPRELYVQERAQLETLKDLQRKLNKHCIENYCSLPEEELKEGEWGRGVNECEGGEWRNVREGGGK